MFQNSNNNTISLKKIIKEKIVNTENTLNDVLVQPNLKQGKLFHNDKTSPETRFKIFDTLIDDQQMIIANILKIEDSVACLKSDNIEKYGSKHKSPNYYQNLFGLASGYLYIGTKNESYLNDMKSIIDNLTLKSVNDKNKFQLQWSMLGTLFFAKKEFQTSSFIFTKLNELFPTSSYYKDLRNNTSINDPSGHHSALKIFDQILDKDSTNYSITNIETVNLNKFGSKKLGNLLTEFAGDENNPHAEQELGNYLDFLFKDDD